MEQKPEDIPKEELLQLCMKLNKRMQAMETRGKEILKKKNSLQLERQKLLSLIESVVQVSLQPTPSENDLDIGYIENIWSDWDRSRREQQATAARPAPDLIHAETTDLLELESVPPQIPLSDSGDASQALAVLDEKNKSLVVKLAKAEAEIERLANVEMFLKQQSKTLENVVIEKTKESEALRKDVDAMRLASEERVVHFQMQLNQSKQREEGKQSELQSMRAEMDKLQQRVQLLSKGKEEKETLLESNKEMIVALQSRLLELEPELGQLRDKVKDHERRYTALQLLKAEQDNILAAVQRESKALVTEKEGFQQRLRELDEARTKAEGQNVKLSAVTEEVNALKGELEEKSATITRLRTEAQSSERNHAMRTAMLATCEAQLETTLQQLAGKDATIQEAVERASNLQVNYASLEARLEERTKDSNAQIAALQQQQVEQQQQHQLLIRAKDQEHLDAQDAIKKDFAKKSAMARQLLSEREEEVRVLSAKVTALQEEISSGAPSERKIFELAQVQSRRDALSVVHRDTREVAFQQLQMKLAAKDYELAQAQQNLQQLGQEVLELRKTKQREGINMDYLKNVVFQFMTFPTQSSERLALLPVIAMLLQFSPREMSDVQQALRDPSFGARIVKEVKRAGLGGPPMGSGSTHGARGSNGVTTSSSSGSVTIVSAATATAVSLDGSRRGPSPMASPRPPQIVSTPQRTSSPQISSTPGMVPASLSDQDLQEKLRTITGDILDLSTMSQDDIDLRLGMLTPSTESSQSPQNPRKDSS